MPTSIITRGSGVSIAGRQSRGLSPAFSRASTAYQSDGRVVGIGVPRFEMVDGRRGVLVEEGTVNLIPSPLVLEDASWTKYRTGTGVMPIVIDNYGTGPDGSHAATRVQLDKGSGDTASDISQVFWQSASGSYPDPHPEASSVWLKTNSAEPVQIRMTLGAAQGPTIITVADTWQRFSTARSASSSTQAALFLQLRGTYGTANQADILVWHPQVERKPYATSFIDGTRAGELLTLPTAGVLGPNEGTWEQRVYVPALSSLSDNACMFHIPRPGGENGFRVQYRTGGPVFELRSHTDDGTKYTNLTTPAAPYANGWHHFVATWQPDAVRFFIDGALKGSASAPKLLTVFDSIARVGHMFAGGVYTLNSCHSDLRVHRRALSDEEIAAHAAGSIVAKDCYCYPFDGDLWPAPGSLGAVVAPSIITRPGSLEVIRR